MTIFTHIKYCLCCCGISTNEIVELKIRHILNYTYTGNAGREAGKANQYPQYPLEKGVICN